jgi:hypothetical protein
MMIQVTQNHFLSDSHRLRRHASTPPAHFICEYGMNNRGKENAPHLWTGLPDGIFSNQKSHFG